MKCDCYHVIEKKPGKFNGECWGTKEREFCTCEGITENCNFYPERRKMKDTDNISVMTRLEAEEKFNIKIVD